ncbi:dienelactone hydrolase family protein [Sorangium sp. So ce375]|uniref:dienelactone hydrolase family protein n=1 Tax=Sorangium sp. So ce375 TaxID=3133306 RepID=UPI003F5C53CA
MNGTKIDIRTHDGVADTYISHPPGPGPFPAVLFYMDAVGLREALFAMADRLASHGYYVFLPNLFYRAGAFAPFDAKVVFAGGAERDRLMRLVDGLTDAEVLRDTAAFLDFLAQQPLVRGPKIGCTGYCLGGGFSILASVHYPERIGAAASFHGAGFVTAPGSPEVIAQRARTPVYVGVAETDRRHTPEVTARLEAACTEAGVPHAIELYAGASHGFAVNDLPVYDQAASERHWERLLAFFRENLG